VSAAQRRTAEQAIAKLPVADRALIARLGLRVQLIPASALEDGMLGATTVVRDAQGRMVATAIRVASRLDGTGVDSLAEVVQHELGHVISVERHQDSSERAAQQYARTH